MGGTLSRDRAPDRPILLGFSRRRLGPRFVDDGRDDRPIRAPMPKVPPPGRPPSCLDLPCDPSFRPPSARWHHGLWRCGIMKHGLLLLAAALAAACTTKPVPGVCCIGAEDCSRLGLTEDRPCLQGEACVDFHCVAASCTNLGCPTETPICDGDTCRGCRLDTECPSGACGDDGACVDEASAVYLSPTGTDAGACPRSAPCGNLRFGAAQTSDIRSHIVMEPGIYNSGFNITIDSTLTPAQQLFIHGHGATLQDTASEPLLWLYVPTTIRDLEISTPSTALTIRRPCVFERLRIRASGGIDLDSHATVRDSTILTEPGGTGISLRPGGSLTWERGVIRGGRQGIAVDFADYGTVEISNLLIFGTSELAINLPYDIRGSISFSTITDAGNATSTGPRSVLCSPSMTIHSSIIWDINSTAQRPAIAGGCALISTVVGKSGVPGAPSFEPLFVNPIQSDYHLRANSPARDMVDVGPALDFEGDPRPRGERFDIGADEAP